MTRIALILAVLFLFPLHPVEAQEPVAVRPGQRVRVTAPALGMKKHEETFQQLRGDTLVFTLMECPLSDVTRLEEHRGRESWGWWKGGLIGFVVGAGAGAAYGAGPGYSDCDLAKEGCMLIFGAIGAVPGVLVGSLVGAAVETDRWGEVPLPPVRPSLQVSANGRLGLGFSIPLRK